MKGDLYGGTLRVFTEEQAQGAPSSYCTLDLDLSRGKIDVHGRQSAAPSSLALRGEGSPRAGCLVAWQSNGPSVTTT
jgi:hypothetical protein